MEITEQFETKIKPFYWVKLSTGASVCLTVGEEYLQDIFDARAFLTPKQICFVPIQKTKKRWQTLFFFSRKRVKIKP